MLKVRFSFSLGGILAGYGRVKVMKPDVDMFLNLPEIHVNIEGEFFLFDPAIGSTLTGIL